MERILAKYVWKNEGEGLRNLYTGGGIEKIHVLVHRRARRKYTVTFMPNYVKRDTWSEYEAADSWFSINAANLRDGGRRGVSVEKWINPVSCDINLEYIYMYIKILHRDGYFLKRGKLFLSFSFYTGDKIKKEKEKFRRWEKGETILIVFKKYLFWQIARINISHLALPFFFSPLLKQIPLKDLAG